MKLFNRLSARYKKKEIDETANPEYHKEEYHDTFNSLSIQYWFSVFSWQKKRFIQHRQTLMQI